MRKLTFSNMKCLLFFGLFGWCSVLFKFGYPCKWFKVENYATWQRFDQLLSRQPASPVDGPESIQPRITCSSSLVDDLTFPKQCFVSNQKVLKGHGPSLYSCFSFITWQDWVEDSRALGEGKDICEGRTLIPKWLCRAENPHPYPPWPTTGLHWTVTWASNKTLLLYATEIWGLFVIAVSRHWLIHSWCKICVNQLIFGECLLWKDAISAIQYIINFKWVAQTVSRWLELEELAACQIPRTGEFQRLGRTWLMPLTTHKAKFSVGGKPLPLETRIPGSILDLLFTNWMTLWILGLSFPIFKVGQIIPFFVGYYED